jgi:D-glycero-D-manno-heptose 1,7-bisphosphate phosphatase
VKQRAAFLDRDGVINLDRAYVYSIEDFEFVPGVFAAARMLRDLGFVLVVTTNQSGIGRGMYGIEQFNTLTEWMKERFVAERAPLAGVYFCPHHPTEANPPYREECECRKPRPGMLLQAERDLGLWLQGSAMFGDRPSDLQAARAAGVSARFLVGTDGVARPAVLDDRTLATAIYPSLLDAVRGRELAAFAQSKAQP